MEKSISIIIPNYNGASTIGKCLQEIFASDYGNYEVVVVDDNSGDDSAGIIEAFPCKLIRLERNSGASRARNIGALSSSGDILFFTDADCLLQKDTLSVINRTFSGIDEDVVIGGTYTAMPYDRGFYNEFQSVFVNYSETSAVENPDYIAAHALAMSAARFRRSKGFPEEFLPIIEDVEFTHHLKGSGCVLKMNPEIQVRHIFGFSLLSSLLNSIKKSRYWTMYSLENKDALHDSGCASIGLKVNVAAGFVTIALVTLWSALNKPVFLGLCPVVMCSNFFMNRKLLVTFFKVNGFIFGIKASIYYPMVYSLSVGAGAVSGIVEYFVRTRVFRRASPKTRGSLSGSTLYNR